MNALSGDVQALRLFLFLAINNQRCYQYLNALFCMLDLTQKKNQLKVFYGAAAVVFGVLIVGSFVPKNSETVSKLKEKSCKKEAWICAAEKKELTMRWGCEKEIKSGLKDPRSYQANDVNYYPSMSPDPALVMIKINYTATNSFGGPVRGNAVCHADANGKILSSKYL